MVVRPRDGNRERRICQEVYTDETTASHRLAYVTTERPRMKNPRQLEPAGVLTIACARASDAGDNPRHGDGDYVGPAELGQLRLSVRYGFAHHVGPVSVRLHEGF